ncbi:hypothetical protein Daus18300_003527 [Diaporthe australafricana]|uniref:NADH-ubiquinone oxidoreductase 29.9 kDa subunit n=1 Tax=Diaporthe australafricana TaxID=127596 RepID=A0ABR3XEY1_9PEZI
MRGTLRLFASVKPVRFLEPGAPTGLTGLHTNPSPRSTLLFLYSSTLDRIKAAPETSVYRQSIEAVTKHRMSLVQSVKPAGYDEWLARARQVLEKHPDHFKETAHKVADGSLASGLERDGKFFVLRQKDQDLDTRYEEWDGEGGWGIGKDEHRIALGKRDKTQLTRGPPDDAEVKWEDEPKLTIDQVEELENKIGAGLIEEVIQVAEGELGLIETMVESKAWESLEEKPAEGQWVYFDRKE